MEKIAVGPEAKGAIDINASVEWNINSVAKAKGIDVSDLTVVILDRPRHADLIAEIRARAPRIRLISDGDVAGAVAAADDYSTVDMLMGIGGTPEGIIAAVAMKCMGGEIEGKLWPRNEEERQKAIDAGHDIDRALTTEDLVRGENCFFCATGVTNGDMLRGVTYRPNGATTRSLVMRSKSGTVRRIESVHRPEKLRGYAGIQR